jgi:hypothetical protein
MVSDQLKIATSSLVLGVKTLSYAPTQMNLPIKVQGQMITANFMMNYHEKKKQ